MGARLLSFVTQSSLLLQGSPVENAEKIRAVLLSGPRREEGPPFIGASRSLSEKILKVHFSVIYAVIL